MKSAVYVVFLAAGFLFFGKDKDESPVPRRELAPRHHNLLVKYAQIRERQMRAIAKKRDIKIAREFRKFFDAATEGDWKRADKLYEKFRLKSGQWETRRQPDPDIWNELWNPVHEVGWAYRLFTTWDPRSIDLFARTIIDAIPDDSIFFGGTDAGRFIIAAFVAAEERSNVYVLTQNALADISYLNYIEDLYGKELQMLTHEDVTKAYSEYLDDIKKGRRPPNKHLKMVDGRVQIQGALGVMEINSVLSQMVFEKNRDIANCYIEESYVLRWIYPYLEPHGPVLKIRRQRGPLTDEAVRKDTAFWADLVPRLTSSEAFQRDPLARRAFAKLRCGIAGTYASRSKLDEAEKAFRQALALDPTSPEANFRLAQEVLLRQSRFSDVRKLMTAFRQHKDLYDTEHRNKRIDSFMEQTDQLESRLGRIRELEAEVKDGQIEIKAAFELADLYRQMQWNERSAKMLAAIEGRDDLPPAAHLRLSGLHAAARDYRRASAALKRYLAEKPDDWKAWLDQATLSGHLQDDAGIAEALQKAIEAGGKGAIRAITKDANLKKLQDRLPKRVK